MKIGIIGRNIIYIALLVVALLVGASFGLNLVTRHGKTVTVPDFTSMELKEAKVAAQEAGLRVKVIDSIFISRLPGGTVFRQIPAPGANAKLGRSIFLTINSFVPRKTIMPNLVGYSYMEARAEITNRGLTIGRLNYIPDMATNNVLEQKFHGRSIEPGSEVVSGSAIDLTLGLNFENSVTAVPNIVGMKYTAAVDALHANCLNVGRMRFEGDVRSYTDTISCFVYKYDNRDSTRTMGSSINVWLTQDKSKLPAGNE